MQIGIQLPGPLHRIKSGLVFIITFTEDNIAIKAVKGTLDNGAPTSLTLDILRI